MSFKIFYSFKEKKPGNLLIITPHSPSIEADSWEKKQIPRKILVEINRNSSQLEKLLKYTVTINNSYFPPKTTKGATP